MFIEKQMMSITFVAIIQDNNGMKKILLNIETVTEYNDLLGVETLHPQVSVINLSKVKPMRHLRHTFSF